MDLIFIEQTKKHEKFAYFICSDTIINTNDKDNNSNMLLFCSPGLVTGADNKSFPD
jgi:hypothetical protein